MIRASLIVAFFLAVPACVPPVLTPEEVREILNPDPEPPPPGPSEFRDLGRTYWLPAETRSLPWSERLGPVKYASFASICEVGPGDVCLPCTADRPCPIQPDGVRRLVDTSEGAEEFLPLPALSSGGFHLVTTAHDPGTMAVEIDPAPPITHSTRTIIARSLGEHSEFEDARAPESFCRPPEPPPEAPADAPIGADIFCVPTKVPPTTPRLVSVLGPGATRRPSIFTFGSPPTP